MGESADAFAELEALHRDIRACTRCGLHATRTSAVPGSGAAPCDVLIVGDAPGFNEDVQGKPFVGAAGRLLDTLLGQIGLSRERVFITNVLKCRPPQNRDPMPNEAEACLPHLRAQFKLLKPIAVIVLGRQALEQMLPGVGSIARVHGQIFERMGVAFMPAYHPAAALQDGSLLNDLQQDFDKVRAYLDQVLGTGQVAVPAGAPDQESAAAKPIAEASLSAAPAPEGEEGSSEAGPAPAEQLRLLW